MRPSRSARTRSVCGTRPTTWCRRSRLAPFSFRPIALRRLCRRSASGTRIQMQKRPAPLAFTHAPTTTTVPSLSPRATASPLAHATRPSSDARSTAGVLWRCPVRTILHSPQVIITSFARRSTSLCLSKAPSCSQSLTTFLATLVWATPRVSICVAACGIPTPTSTAPCSASATCWRLRASKTLRRMRCALAQLLPSTSSTTAIWTKTNTSVPQTCRRGVWMRRMIRSPPASIFATLSFTRAISLQGALRPARCTRPMASACCFLSRALLAGSLLFHCSLPLAPVSDCSALPRLWPTCLSPRCLRGASFTASTSTKLSTRFRTGTMTGTLMSRALARTQTSACSCPPRRTEPTRGHDCGAAQGLAHTQGQGSVFFLSGAASLSSPPSPSPFPICRCCCGGQTERLYKTTKPLHAGGGGMQFTYGGASGRARRCLADKDLLAGVREHRGRAGIGCAVARSGVLEREVEDGAVEAVAAGHLARIGPERKAGEAPDAADGA
eukprot:m.285223 g.285223  ORF g.285223 m.285223 type:complete len:498 (+) comp11328_c0_seq1:253-1746(+)